MVAIEVRAAQETIVVLTDANPDVTITKGSTATVYGTSGGSNDVTIESGANAKLINFPGSNNTITIEADPSLFTVSRSGATVTFQGSDNTVLKMPATKTNQILKFEDGGIYDLIITNGELKLANQKITRETKDVMPLMPLFVEELAKDTWHYLQNATKNHLPFSWTIDDYSGGDYCNPAEIGFLALSYIAAYNLSRSWSPECETVESEVMAILNQLRNWQTGNQVNTHGANAYENSVFYRWYWISWNPPVVGADIGGNQEVPSIDNAWLAASLITIAEYAKSHNHINISSLANDILKDMDFTKWYDDTRHQFYWGGGGGKATKSWWCL